VSTQFKTLPSCVYSEDTFDHEMECTEFHIDAILAFIARESGAEVQEVVTYVGSCTQTYARSFIEALNILFGEYRWDAYHEGRDDVPYIYSKTGRFPERDAA
jgi:hypothetical protein